MMYKKALDAVKKKSRVNESADEQQYESDLSGSEESDISEDERHGDDSDEELMKKFASGELKPGTYNRVPDPSRVVEDAEGMKSVLAKFSHADLPWIERLDLIVPPAEGPEDDDNSKPVHDDFKRELHFYRLAQSGVLQGIVRLRKLAIPTRRPDDYFAQMLKSDDHMQRVRAALVKKNLQIERSTKAKKQRELKKMGKKIQAEVLLSRQDAKKNMLQAVKRYRQGQKDRLDAGDLGEILGDSKKGAQAGKNFPNKKKGVNKRRQWKNEKFGYGGQKKRRKLNTAESYGDMRNYAADRDGISRVKRGGRGGKMSRGGGQQRPGKMRRQTMKRR